MIVREIRLLPLPFPFIGGGFASAYGRRTHLNNLLIVLETVEGHVGLGEMARLTPISEEPIKPEVVADVSNRLKALVGVNARELAAAPSILGELPSRLSNLAAAVDMAAFDLIGQDTGRPLCDVVGERRQSSVPEYVTISKGSPDEMADAAQVATQQGISVVQIKVGGTGPEGQAADEARIGAILDAMPSDATLLCDANGGWDMVTARTMLSGQSDDRILWEEPTETYDDIRALAEATGKPVMLDQCLKLTGVLERAVRDGVASGVGIKTSMQGGIGAARDAIDLAVNAGLSLKIDDSWGCDPVTATSLQLALCVPPDQLVCGIDMTPYFVGGVSRSRPVRADGRVAPAAGNGLGLDPLLEELGEPLAVLAT